LAKSLKDRYVDLISSLRNQNEKSSETVIGGESSPGTMLLLAFDALFNNLELTTNHLHSACGSLDIPAEWLGVDSVFAGVNASKQTMDPKLDELVALATFMSRVMVIKEFFAVCTKSMFVFKGDPSYLGEPMPTGDDLARPVKIFLADFHRRRLQGLSTKIISTFVCSMIDTREPVLLTDLPKANDKDKLSMEELSRAFVNRSVDKVPREVNRFLHLEVESLHDNLRKVEMARYMDQNIEALKANHNACSLQRNSFQWFHESLLPLNQLSLVPPIR